MLALELLADQKILEAIERGELDDDALIPEELRLAYRILKNAGFVPPEVDELREIAQLERLLQSAEAGVEAHARALRRLALLKTSVENRYFRQVIGKLSR